MTETLLRSNRSSAESILPNRGKLVIYQPGLLSNNSARPAFCE